MHNKQHRNAQKKSQRRRTKTTAYPLREGRSTARSYVKTRPDEFDVCLEYANSGTLTSGVSAIASKEWYPNSAYDVDPSLGSTETPGFDEYAHLYTYYRVVSYRYKIEIVNMETVPVKAFVFNTNTTMTSSNYDVISGTPYCSRKLMAPAGSGNTKSVFSGRIACSKLLGSIAAETSDSFRALVSASPADILHLALAVERTSGAAFVTGLPYTVSVKMDVRFYGGDFDLVLLTSETALQKAQERVDFLKAQAEGRIKKRIELAQGGTPKKC